ncbi:MAG: DnaJ domain-containing protein [Myxococcota bacterium]|nr:DnaJ domain-containing protein [Myxococcota bacterium]
MSQDAARSMIREFHEAMAAKNHYELFEVSRGAGKSDINAAYRRLIKMFHVDAFHSVELGDAAPLLDEINKRISEAHKALSHTERRAEYDASLEFQADQDQGDGTDAVSENQIEEIFAAEDAFRRGKAHVERGQFDAALERFAVALRVNPHDPDTRAFHMFTRFMTQPVSKAGRRGPEAEKILNDLGTLARDEKERVVPVLLYAKLLKLNGDNKKAAAAFRRVLSIEDKHAEATRELRLLQSRMQDDSGSKGGFLEKLKGFLNRKV